jgi:methylated-DNA-protein-cysteine methyltransferase-like protein
MYTYGMSHCEKYSRIYNVVKQIPIGKVSTYGQVATLAGYHGQARQVGYALNALTDDLDIPWQRVINSKGQISKRANPIFEEIQKEILESEGIQFDLNGRVDLARYKWEPGSA